MPVQHTAEKWLFLQSMDSHPEQIALRPKEFFRTYDIEVLTEMQVRRVLRVPARCLLCAGTPRLCLGNAAALSVLGSLDAVAAMLCLSQLPSFMPQGTGCLWLLKTTINAVFLWWEGHPVQTPW